MVSGFLERKIASVPQRKFLNENFVLLDIYYRRVFAALKIFSVCSPDVDCAIIFPNYVPLRIAAEKLPLKSAKLLILT